MSFAHLIRDQLAANHRVAVAVVDVLGESGEAAIRARAMRALGDEAPALHQAGRWISPKRMVALFEAAGLSRSRGRRVGQLLMRPGRVGLALCYGGLATPEKAYRRVDDLLARESAIGRYYTASIDSECARVAYSPAAPGADARSAWPAELGPAVCGMREGMLEAVPMLFGLLPGRVRETQCAFEGAEHCEFEVRWTRNPRRGLALGAAVGGVLGGLGLAALGVPAWGWVLGVVGLALLAGGTGRAVDLAQQLEAVGGARRGQLALLEQLESGLAERMDDIARLGERPASAESSLSQGEGLVPVSQAERSGGSAGAVMAAAGGQATADLQEAAMGLAEQLEDLEAMAQESGDAADAWREGLDHCRLHARRMEAAAGVLGRAMGAGGGRRENDLKKLVEAALARFRAGQPTDLLIAEELEDGLSPVACDAGQIEFVVEQLLAIARAASSGDAEVTIRVGLRAAPGGVEVVVEDEGERLEAELIDRIFDPFVEGDAESSEPGQGGLRACLRVVEDHGGEFVVQPADERGNRIAFVLPAPEGS
ncbi:MAG: ATP-binding protein [Myxococcota bacterium]|nr:ATP-binding protein [Myxococcota bacterium]